MYAPKIWVGPEAIHLVLTKRIGASGNENGVVCCLDGLPFFGLDLKRAR